MFYFNEIKIRLVLISSTFICMFLVSYLYKETMLFLIIKPNYSNLNFFYFIFTNVMEIFSVYLNLILFVCYQVLILYIIFHIFIFLSSALFFKEYIFLFFLLRFVLLIWIFTINLLNFWLIPLFWDFFLSFQTNSFYSMNLQFEARLSEYTIFYRGIYYLFFIYFQFFICMFFMFFYNMFYNIKLIKKLRKVFYFIFFIFSTFISPPDIFSQICLSLLSIILYEFFFFISLIRLGIKQVTN